MPRHAARRAHLSALLLLLVLSIGAARAAEAQHEAPHSYSTTTSSSSSPAAALIALLGSGAALLAAVVLLALCAEAGPESPKTAPLQPSNQPDAHLVAAAAASSPPNGAALPYAVHTIAHQPGSANGQPSRPPAPIPAPAPAPAVQPGAAYAYGQPLFNQAQSAPPPQPASTDLYFARTVGPDGMLAYAAISLAEAEAMMARGEQVFIRPDKEQAGQDIYEAVPNRDDLYSVASRGGNPGGDIYTVPTRKPAAANASSAPAAAETATAAASADGSSSTSPVASRGMVTNHMTPKVQPVLQYDDVDGAPTVVPLPQQQDLYEAVDDDDARPPPKPAAVPPPKPEAAQPPKPAAPLPQAPPQPRKLYGEEALRCWMARSMSRDDAAEVLRGSPPGTFIVRKSASDGSSVISLVHSSSEGPDRVAHFRLIMESSSCYIFDKTGVERRFVTLQDLLTHYKKHDPKEKGGLPARLEICLPYTK